MQRLPPALLVLLVVACIPVLAYIALLGASDVHVSGGMATAVLKSGGISAWVREGIPAAAQPWLPTPRVTHVEKVGAPDALRNLLFIVCEALLSGLLPVLAFIAGVILILDGLFTADWTSFGVGLLMALLWPLFVIFVVLGIFAEWVALLFQPCTPVYALLWALLGLPFAGLGAVVGAGPSVTVIVIVKQ